MHVCEDHSSSKISSCSSTFHSNRPCRSVSCHPGTGSVVRAHLKLFNWHRRVNRHPKKYLGTSTTLGFAQIKDTKRRTLKTQTVCNCPKQTKNKPNQKLPQLGFAFQNPRKISPKGTLVGLNIKNHLTVSKNWGRSCKTQKITINPGKIEKNRINSQGRSLSSHSPPI